LCLGVLMIVLDSTIVNIALPAIQSDLGFSATSLVWVVNAYVLTYGGFLLLGGRLGDLFGGRRLFLIGIGTFTAASLACGLVGSQAFLLGARAAQGLGAAIVDAVSLSLIMNIFTAHSERARAMGVYGFVRSVGGTLGIILGGVVTSTWNWHWIFLINVPLGLIVCGLCLELIPTAPRGGRGARRNLDVSGAVTVTTSLLLAVYAIVDADATDWTSPRFIGVVVVSVGLMATFLMIESRVRDPLVPLGLFRSRPLAVANIAFILWSAAMFAWFFLCGLYLQRAIGMNSMQAAFVFAPATGVMGVIALFCSAAIVTRFGVKVPIVMGFAIAAVGLTLFATSPADEGWTLHVIPGMVLLGIGAGAVFNPLLLSAMNGVESKDYGLASGLVNTSTMMGGALGLAILVSAATSRSRALSGFGVASNAALLDGYHLAFAIGACLAVAAGACGAWLLPARGEHRVRPQSPAE
jgi:EmrB/QacA subfamily drug resistance transporter